MPESRHQQYSTYAFFVGDQTAFVFRNADRPWGALGGALALLEKGDWGSRPQFVAFGTANTAFHLNQKKNTVLTETIDARVGIAIEAAIRDDLRFSVGWIHYSGHVADDVPDPSLKGPNLGDELIPVRVIHDIGGSFRLGATISPIVGSEPGMRPWASDQFGEWFPLGTSPTHRKPTPYLALGLQEMGVDRVFLTYHIQLGAYFGNHMRPEKRSTLRFVGGYYRGMDPRLKYAQFMLSRVEFGYLGVMADI